MCPVLHLISDDLDDDLATEEAEIIAGLEKMLASWLEFERLYGAGEER